MVLPAGSNHGEGANMLWAFVGGAGGAIIFVSLLAGLAIVGSLALAYAARCFLVVVQGTAVGMDEVDWPDEPMFDWIGHTFILAWLIAVWLAPLGFLLRVLKSPLLTEQPGYSFLLFGGMLWLCFPLGVLSSLGSQSPWAFFKPSLLLGLLRITPATLSFYGSSLLVALVGLGSWALVFVQEIYLLAPVAAAVAAAAWLIYARLLGRLAWELHQLKPLRLKRTDKPSAVRDEEPAEKEESEDLGEELSDSQPNPPPPGPEMSPEAAVVQPRKARVPLDDDDEDSEPYGLSAEAPPPPPRVADLVGPLDEEPADDEARAEEPERPRRKRRKKRGMKRDQREERAGTARSQGVLTFPWYATTLRAWVGLSMAGTVVGFFLAGVISFFPGG